MTPEDDARGRSEAENRRRSEVMAGSELLLGRDRYVRSEHAIDSCGTLGKMSVRRDDEEPDRAEDHAPEGAGHLHAVESVEVDKPEEWALWQWAVGVLCLSAFLAVISFPIWAVVLRND